MHYSSSTALLSASLMYLAIAANAICPVAQQQCCRIVSPASEPVTAALLNCLGVPGVPGDLTVGVTCTPHPFASEISCDGRLVCCTDNSHGGVAALNCTAGLL